MTALPLPRHHSALLHPESQAIYPVWEIHPCKRGANHGRRSWQMAGSRPAEPVGVAEPLFGDGLRLAVAGRRRRRHRMGRARRSERPVWLRLCAGVPGLLRGYPLGGPARPVVVAATSRPPPNPIDATTPKSLTQRISDLRSEQPDRITLCVGCCPALAPWPLSVPIRRGEPGVF